jgi:hypothetical protein
VQEVFHSRQADSKNRYVLTDVRFLEINWNLGAAPNGSSGNVEEQITGQDPCASHPSMSFRVDEYDIGKP